jgi:hypothetical protein
LVYFGQNKFFEKTGNFIFDQMNQNQMV